MMSNNTVSLDVFSVCLRTIQYQKVRVSIALLFAADDVKRFCRFP